jgi:hypothetical protein
MPKPKHLFCLVWLIAFLGAALSLPLANAQNKITPYMVTPKWNYDGSLIAIAVQERIEIHSAVTGALLYTLAGHNENVLALAWNPLDNRLASSALDLSVKIWNAANGQIIHNLIGHTDVVSGLLWLPDGNKLLSAAIQGNSNLFIWDTNAGRQLARHEIGTVFDIAISPERNRFVYSASLALDIRNSVTFDQVAEYRWECCINQIDAVLWSLDGTKLITGSLNGIISIWDASDLQLLRQFAANNNTMLDGRDVENLALSWVRAITLGSSGNTVLAVSGDGTLREWDIETGILIEELKLSPLAAAAWSPYAGRLLYLDITMLPKGFGVTGAFIYPNHVNFKIVVPAPSFEKLNTLARRCVQDGNATQSAVAQLAEAAVTESSLEAFIAQVKTLPVDAIPPACAADLLAIAAALQGK